MSSGGGGRELGGGVGSSVVTWGRGWVGVLGVVGVGGWYVGPAETVGGAGGTRWVKSWSINRLGAGMFTGVNFRRNFRFLRDVLPEPSTFTKY